MANYEQNHGSHERRNNDEIRLSLDYFDISADLIDDMGEFAVNLNSDRPSTSSEFNFAFFEDSLGNVVIPHRISELQRRFGTLDGIELNYTHHENDPYSHFALHFQFTDHNDDCATLTVITEQAATEEHIEAISTDEINWCIASLVYPSKSGDYSFFSTMDLNDGERYEDLMALFQKHADYFTEEETYDLFAKDETKEGTLRYVIKDGDLITTELQRITLDELIIEDDGTINHRQKVLVTEIDLSTGTSINFKKLMSDPRSGDLITEPYTPRKPDYEELFAFIKHHNGMTNPVRPERFDDEATPYTDTTD